GGLSVRAGLDLAGLRMQPFLTAFAGWDRLIGTADARIDLLGAGDTAQALVESLDGALSLDLGRGQIDGLDLAGLVRTRDLSHRGEGATTVFDGASATLDVVDGIGTGDLTIDAPVLTATGTGRVDLGARTLDWRLLPTLRTPEVTVPVTVRGPWDDPDIRPDLEWVARQALEADRDEVEARARAEAEALLEKAEEAARREAGRLAEDLGVEARDDRPVEDVIRERVESELLDLLLGR
ncbi:MAG: AsmA-like C-terminal region-containing protein, partial [Pseudomonadota bacterium]